MPDSKTDPQRLPSPSVAETKQAEKRSYIPTWALIGIVVVIAALLLYAAVR